MKRVHYIYVIFAALLTLASCSDFNERLDGYNANDYKPTDVKTLTLEYTTKKFATQTEAQQSLPAWLKSSYPTADAGSTAKVTYQYTAQTAAGKDTTLTDMAPFELIGTEWVFNPSVTVTIPNVKQDNTAYKFYQAACDWVWAEVDQAQLGVTKKGKGYVVSYGNTEYYAGSDRYNSCVDWRPSAVRNQIASQYEGMTDDQIVTLMQTRFTELYAKVLTKLYPDATPITGMDVIYTLNFTAKAPALTKYQIKYKVTAKAQFTYVEGSLKPTE